MLTPSVANANDLSNLNYNVHHVRIGQPAPVIDGVVSKHEWDNTSKAAGDFTLLRQYPLKDTENTRFQMLWDDQALYLLIRSDYGGWNDPPLNNYGDPSFSSDDVSANIYFNPRPSIVPFPQNLCPDVGSCPQAVADGYQFAMTVDKGFAKRNPVRSGDYIMGLFLTGHTGFLFGNGGNYSQNDSCATPPQNYRDCDHPGITIAQTAGPSGAVIEMKILWSEFNAQGGTGAPLYHPFAPNMEDKWAFELGMITNDLNNFITTWSDRKAVALGVTTFGSINGRFFLAQWPHGTITFKGEDASNDDNDND